MLTAIALSIVGLVWSTMGEYSHLPDRVSSIERKVDLHMKGECK